MIYRADHVGSLLRPSTLLTARKQDRVGTLPAATFKGLEDQAVNEAIAMQERTGIDVLSDGEMRRAVFTSQPLDGTRRL